MAGLFKDGTFSISEMQKRADSILPPRVGKIYPACCPFGNTPRFIFDTENYTIIIVDSKKKDSNKW